jgi:Na+/proline symporter
MGMPRRITVKGMQGVDVTVIVTVVQNMVWMSISPSFTWEAIMTPGKVDDVMRVLELARDEAAKTPVANGRVPHASTVVRAITKNATHS